MSIFGALEVYHDDAARSAAMNMAIDEALLEMASTPSIRFYRWHSPALSFGYFGRFTDVVDYAAQRDLVRRWTGGGIVLHGDDLTYSVIIPRNDPVFAGSSMSIYENVHRALCEALSIIAKHADLLAVAAVCDRRTSKDRSIHSWEITEREINATVTDRRYNDCFANPVRADVLVNGRKVAGAAQRRTRAGLLHQGSIQQIDLGKDFTERFAQELSSKWAARNLEQTIFNRAQEIGQQKYANQAWLRRR
jgi:lipoyl(octanoyl) transferase